MNFYDQFRAACVRRNTTMTRVLKDLGKSTSSTAVWKRGKYPQLDTVMEIANHLDMSLDELCYGPQETDKKSLKSPDKSNQGSVTVKAVHNNPDKKKRELLQTATQSNLLTQNGQEWISLLSRIPAERQAPLKDLLRAIVDTTPNENKE